MFHNPHSQPTLRHLWILRLLLAFTAFSIAMPVMTLFWKQRGISQAEANLAQAVFTAVIIALNVPTGRWADRFGRRRSMVTGYSLCALGFTGYATAQGFLSVVAWECVVGIGAAFVSGANTGLLKAYCQNLGRDIRQERALISILSAAGALIAYTSVTLFGTSLPAAVLVVEGVLYAGFALASRQLVEAGTLDPRTPLRTVLKDIAQDQRLRWRILAMAFSRELTHAPVWVFTPLMLVMGVPPALIGLGWGVQALAEGLAGAFTLRRALHLGPRASLAVSTLPSIVASLVLVLRPSAITVFATFIAFSFTRTLTGALVGPLVTQASHDAHVSTTESVAGTISRLVYIPAVAITGLAGNVNPVGAIAANVALFAIPLVGIWLVLARSENPKPNHGR